MKTCAAYIRVSTDMQTELSPDSQLKIIKQYAKQHDMILSKDYIFADDGISGRTAEKRPEFMRMIATAKQKPRPFDTILVWKFSRFARNREDSIVYKSMLRKDCGIDVVSVSEPVGEDKTSILIEALLEAMDEYYSLNLAEEVRRGMTEKVSRGGIVVAPPQGYTVKDGKYVIEPTQAEMIRKVFADYLKGKGTHAIAKELNALGYRTKNGNLLQNRSIEYILANPTYTGKLRYTPTGKATTAHSYRTTDETIIVDGSHEPIIDTETFDAVQKLLQENKSKYPKNYHQRDIDFYFRGLIRCSSCGATLTRSTATGLQCYQYAHGVCTESHYISTNKLRDTVISAMKTDAADGAELRFIEQPKPAENKSTNDLIADQIEREKIKLERIKAAYEDGIDTLEEYKANKIKINKTIAQLKTKLTAEDDNRSSRDISAFKDKISECIDTISAADISPELFNDSLREIIAKIVFDRAKNEVRIFYKA